MKPHHVQARIDKRGVTRCVPTCSGWVVRTSPGRPVLMACIACNALHPPRLQITDRMVKQLPLAQTALVAVKRQVARDRTERQTTRHLTAGPYNALAALSGGKALCGEKLGRTKGGRRFHAAVSLTVRANCAECLRINAMTPAERDAERTAKSEELRVRFASKRDEEVRAREEKRQATAALIADATHDARVAWDIMQEVEFDRVQLVVSITAAAAGKGEETRAKQADDRAMFVERTLAMAVTAQRAANPKSRGERRWMFRGANGNTGSVVCRFCDELLISKSTLGMDHTIDTDDHTVRCALRYLGGEPPTSNTAEDDAEQVVERARQSVLASTEPASDT